MAHDLKIFAKTIDDAARAQIDTLMAQPAFADCETESAKAKHYRKLYDAAPLIKCKCGCGELIKSMDRYGRKKEYISGHNRRKYSDNTQYKREWNHRNREKRYEYKRDFIAKRKLELINMLGGKCEVCEIVADISNIAIFDFHHKNPDEKEFNLGQNTIGNMSFENVKKEASKCSVLCSNCHRLLHFSR